MICSNCNKEIPDGNLYCIYCHAPTGLENDIDVNIDILEDEELLQTYQEEREKRQNKNKDTKIAENKKKEKHKNKKLPIVIIAIVSVLVLVVIIFFTASNSYSSTLKKANASFNKKDYTQSLKLYESCLSKRNDSTDALIGIGMSYVGLKDTQKAESYFIKAIESDPDSSDAFRALMQLYSAENNQDKILEIGQKYATTKKQTEILSEYLIEAPEYSEVEGEYTDDIELTLSTDSGYDIYYTTDGSDPRDGNGKLFEKDIVIKEGATTVMACCYDGKTFGSVREEKFVIKYDAPEYPTVSPMNGVFSEPTNISISTEESGASIYYTWDGSDPTTGSSRYTEPIPVPEGNNVLSVIVVGANGKQSGILRCSYTLIY